MLTRYYEIIESLEGKISDLNLEIDNPIVLSEESIKLVLKSLSALIDFVLQRTFKNEQGGNFVFQRAETTDTFKAHLS